VSQFLIEEALATALELHETSLLDEQRDRQTQEQAVDKSTARRERARQLGGAR
jgi:hypothetical protein